MKILVSELMKSTSERLEYLIYFFSIHSFKGRYYKLAEKAKSKISFIELDFNHFRGLVENYKNFDVNFGKEGHPTFQTFFVTYQNNRLGYNELFYEIQQLADSIDKIYNHWTSSGGKIHQFGECKDTNQVQAIRDRQCPGEYHPLVGRE